MNELLKLKQVVSCEADRFRNLISNPLCDSQYNEFIYTIINNLEWTKNQIDKISSINQIDAIADELNLKKGYVPYKYVPIGDRVVGLRHD